VTGVPPPHGLQGKQRSQQRTNCYTRACNAHGRIQVH
jgi:hypothetical protein